MPNHIEIISNKTDFFINDVNIHRYENVISYKYALCTPKLNLEINNDIKSENTNYYFIFDCPGEDALGHWVYESFIFYSLYSEIKTHFKSSLQILSSNHKKYVKSLLRFFNLDTNIVYKIDTNTKNVCYFPPIISMNDLKDVDIFKKYIHIYANSIKERLIIFPQSIDNLFLPRNKKDNYVINDRIIPFTEEICNNIIENGGTVLNTYELNNMNLQYNIIFNSDCIIMDYGSSFMFNCIFLENKKIILLHNDNLNFYLSFYANKIIFDYIKERNTISFVDVTKPVSISSIISLDKINEN